MKNTLICGVGNKLYGDDGLGPYIVELLEEKDDIPDNVRVADFGISGFKCALTLSDYDRVIFVDAISLPGSEPGKPHLLRLTEDQLRHSPNLGNLNVSMHETDLVKILATASVLGFYPQEVIIIGVEPEDASVREGLTETVKSKIPQIVDAIYKLINEDVSQN